MTNKINTVLYTGSTKDLVTRGYQHKQKAVVGFTQRYNVDKLVYYEVHDTMENAALREIQIKAGSRKKKIQLIESMNPTWKDLYDDIIS